MSGMGGVCLVVSGMGGLCLVMSGMGGLGSIFIGRHNVMVSFYFVMCYYLRLVILRSG